MATRLLKGISLALLPILVIGVVVVFAYQSNSVDKQCRMDQSPPATYSDIAKTAEELLQRGGQAFDRGDCQGALAAYTEALTRNPNYAEAYNNRAYTYMRMQNFAPALQDLNQALRIRPDYLHALMNRGDIHNYYFEKDRNKAIEDYDHILRLGGQDKERSVCGHRAVAIYSLPGHEGWNVKSWLTLVLSREDVCKMKQT